MLFVAIMTLKQMMVIAMEVFGFGCEKIECELGVMGEISISIFYLTLKTNQFNDHPTISNNFKSKSNPTQSFPHSQIAAN